MLLLNGNRQISVLLGLTPGLSGDLRFADHRTVEPLNH
jgi:hypothetical protein